MAQRPTSIATDISLLRHFGKAYRFTTPGQSVRFTSHLTNRTGLYASFSYHSTGDFEERLQAQPRSFPFPPTVTFSNRGELAYQQLSIGATRYLRNYAFTEEGWQLYGTAGFGLLFGRITNKFDGIDTALYEYPTLPQSGRGRFRRLTLDLAIGAEAPIGGSVYLYGELRTWIQASNTPSPYLHNNEVPRAALVNVGLRLLFD